MSVRWFVGIGFAALAMTMLAMQPSSTVQAQLDPPLPVVLVVDEDIPDEWLFRTRDVVTRFAACGGRPVAVIRAGEGEAGVLCPLTTAAHQVERAARHLEPRFLKGRATTAGLSLALRKYLGRDGGQLVLLAGGCEDDTCSGERAAVRRFKEAGGIVTVVGTFPPVWLGRVGENIGTVASPGTVLQGVWCGGGTGRGVCIADTHPNRAELGYANRDGNRVQFGYPAPLGYTNRGAQGDAHRGAAVGGLSGTGASIAIGYRKRGVLAVGCTLGGHFFFCMPFIIALRECGML